jgi:hypothetical protein
MNVVGISLFFLLKFAPLQYEKRSRTNHHAKRPNLFPPFFLFLARCEQCNSIREHIQIVSVVGYTLVSNINHGNRPNRIYIVCVDTTRGSSIGGGAAFVNAEDLRLTIFSVAIIRAC